MAVPMHRHAHAHTWLCTYMPLHIHVAAHTWLCNTCLCTYMALQYMPIHIHTHAHTWPCSYTAVHIHACVHHAHAHICPCTYMPMHIYAHAHTCPCTYMACTYRTHLCPLFLSIGAFSGPCDYCTLKLHTQGMLSAFVPHKEITCYLSFPKTV